MRVAPYSSTYLTYQMPLRQIHAAWMKACNRMVGNLGLGLGTCMGLETSSFRPVGRASSTLTSSMGNRRETRANSAPAGATCGNRVSGEDPEETGVCPQGMVQKLPGRWYLTRDIVIAHRCSARSQRAHTTSTLRGRGNTEGGESN